MKEPRHYIGGLGTGAVAALASDGKILIGERTNFELAHCKRSGGKSISLTSATHKNPPAGFKHLRPWVPEPVNPLPRR